MVAIQPIFHARFLIALIEMDYLDHLKQFLNIVDMLFVLKVTELPPDLPTIMLPLSIISQVDFQ